MSPDPLRPYRESQRAHGTDFRVTLWANPASQKLRFQTFTQMLFLGDKRILDAGCSRGDFAAFLLERDIAYRRFIGVDGVREVIEFAQKRQFPRSEFHFGDLLADEGLFKIGDPQVICVSGTLNTMTDEQARGFLESAWDAAGEALLFNFLSDRTGPRAVPQHDPARRMDPIKLLEWALGHTWNVVFRQDYFKAGHDATILMRKEG